MYGEKAGRQEGRQAGRQAGRSEKRENVNDNNLICEKVFRESGPWEKASFEMSGTKGKE